MRLIDADKIHPDVRTKREALAISQGQLAYAPTVEAIPIHKGATNRDIIKALFPEVFVTNCRLVDKVGYFNFDEDWWNAPYKGE